MVTPSPNPARFDGHWLTPREMAGLAGVTTVHLARLDLAGRLPAGAVIRTPAGQRRYDAGKVLAARRQETR